MNCVMCGSPLPPDQGSRTCSMCYGDIDHGKDGYYREQMERDQQRQEEREQYENEFAGSRCSEASCGDCGWCC